MKIAYLGSAGFPHGLAEVSKQILISKALIYSGAEVTVICNKGTNHHGKFINRRGKFEEINYIYTSIITHNPENNIVRKIFKFIGIIGEFIYLMINRFDVAIINSRSIFQILYYRVISKIKKIRIFLTIVEDPDAMPGAQTLSGKINNTLFNKFTWELVDGAFPISEFLIGKINKNNSDVPILKIPALVDVAIFDKIVKNTEEKYYLFCGAAAYFEIIKFIIDSYNLLSNTEYKLILVINGSDKAIGKIDNEIKKSPKNNLITKFGYQDYNDLISLYKNAAALLIPLRPIDRDIARFPHKIGEYCASGNPIISTNYGEIQRYFTHFNNALIASNYDVEEYSKLMKFVISNPELSEEIGRNGRKLCEKEFDYRIFGEKIMAFVREC